MRIGVIGRTAYGSELCDGQTIKTRVLIEELKLKYPKDRITIADTYNYKKNPIKMVLSIFRVMHTSDIVFVLLSRNGMRVIFPLINLINGVYKRPILHDCIGGSLDKLVEQRPSLSKQLSKFTVNWVESEKMKERLELQGIRNVEYLPNFKRLKCKSKSEILLRYPDTFRFCTFSRVNEAKGIGRACEAVIAINNEYGQVKALLDIYGPIEDNYDVTMNEYIKESNGAIRYCGVVASDDSVATLSGAYALLFPTTFYGEGFPGTIIDAFSAGVPVIATDWHLNSEIIKDGKTGYVYDYKQPDMLIKCMRKLMDSPETAYQFSVNCIDDASMYSPDIVMGIIGKKIDSVLSNYSRS